MTILSVVLSSHFPSITSYLFCSHPHICRYISHWKRTGEHPPNFRSLSSSLTCIVFSRFLLQVHGAMENLCVRNTDVKTAYLNIKIYLYLFFKVQHAYYTMLCPKSPVFPVLE